MQNLFELNSVDTKVFAASFKNVQQVHEDALTGCQSVTVNAEIMDKLLAHPLTDWSASKFIKDWEEIYGKGKAKISIKNICKRNNAK